MTSGYFNTFHLEPNEQDIHEIRPEDLITTYDAIDDQHPRLYDDITAGEYLEERLREIGLK